MNTPTLKDGTVNTPDEFAKLRRIAARLANQDRSYVQHPAYEIQKQVRHTGMDTDQIDGCGILWALKGVEIGSHLWPVASQVYEDGGESFIDPEDCESVYAMDQLERIGYEMRWETVQTCFTEEGAYAYLFSVGHTLDGHGEPRVMVESFYRNEEMIAVRELLPRLLERLDEMTARAENAEAEFAALRHDLKALLREVADAIDA